MPKEAVGESELKRISATLAKLAAQFDPSLYDMQVRQTSVPATIDTTIFPRKAVDNLALAEALFAERRRRDTIFKAHRFLLGEPSWDILLFLYIGGKRRWAASVAHASQASGAPATTALRCIVRLEADGLIAREEDSADRRRTLLVLTDAAIRLLDAYIDSLRPSEL